MINKQSERERESPDTNMRGQDQDGGEGGRDTKMQIALSFKWQIKKLVFHLQSYVHALFTALHYHILYKMNKSRI